MGRQKAELSIIQDISKRLVEAQRQIRILDLIKWDEKIKEDFFRNKATKMPDVDASYYNKSPLPFNATSKIEEFQLILRDTQNQCGQYSPLTRLIKRRCDEYIRAVQMLEARGSPEFSKIAMELYGSPDDVFYANGPRLSDLGTLLFDVLTSLDIQLQSEADKKRHTAQEAQKILQKTLGSYFQQHKHKISITISDDMVADASAGADSIKLSQKAMFSDRDLKYLEVHEGWVHVGTTLNGSLQPHCFFLSKGSPSCSVTQEGLAVMTEVVSLSSYPGRLRKITNRVIALDKVKQGANFLDVYHYLLECGLNEEDSYNHAVRIFRGSTPEGGPFTKDLSYAKGFLLIYNLIRFAISQHKIDVVPFLFMGKIVLDELPMLRALKEEGILSDPIFLPPPFRDISAVSAWMSLSLFLNKFNLEDIQKNLCFLLT